MRITSTVIRALDIACYLLRFLYLTPLKLTSDWSDTRSLNPPAEVEE
jgi:hypothetical protein